MSCLQFIQSFPQSCGVQPARRNHQTRRTSPVNKPCPAKKCILNQKNKHYPIAVPSPTIKKRDFSWFLQFLLCVRCVLPLDHTLYIKWGISQWFKMIYCSYHMFHKKSVSIWSWFSQAWVGHFRRTCLGPFKWTACIWFRFGHPAGVSSQKLGIKSWKSLVEITCDSSYPQQLAMVVLLGQSAPFTRTQSQKWLFRNWTWAKIISR